VTPGPDHGREWDFPLPAPLALPAWDCAAGGKETKVLVGADERTTAGAGVTTDGEATTVDGEATTAEGEATTTADVGAVDWVSRCTAGDVVRVGAVVGGVLTGSFVCAEWSKSGSSTAATKPRPARGMSARGALLRG
jgi:hypothetical protein